MLASVLTRGSDPRRLRILLVLLFLALAVPTGLVVWQAWSRLKWESFHQYRSQAEELTRRVDREIGERIAVAEGRSFADFAFISGGGGGILRRSPLSAYPVDPQLPGLVGYFQVDANGSLTTPLLPDAGTDPASVGIGAEEYRARLALTQEIGRILADNRLVVDRAIATVSGPAADSSAGPAASEAVRARTPERDEGKEELEAPPGLAAAARQDIEFRDRRLSAPETQSADATYAQRMFDQLSQAPRPAVPGSLENEAEPAHPAETAQRRANVYGKVQDLRLDEALNRKSEKFAETDGDLGRAVAEELRITAFESELDPFEFSLLDSGHFVLFRKVWRNSERYIQGALIEQRAFLDGVVESAFRATALSGMSDLVVAYRDDVIGVVGAGGRRPYAVEASGLEGALLYRTRLSAPLDALELIYSVNRLPPGPGAAVLGWSTLLLAAVFLGGFFALYRLGMGQIGLARKQQDFVSAVSHELKSPLTSIRMYGEMLKEGWVDEGRRQQYYAYIHDESERLTRLIDNVLRLASITRNGLDLDLRAIAAGDLMDRVRAKISGPAERAGFELDFAVDAAARDRELQVDEDCFTQIFINLVDNAIKFSRQAETRRIEIAARLSGGGRVRFSVRDYGPGVPRDQMKKIFQLFYRSESELTRETVGTGIGLAIVHQLATAMSGRVDVVNRDPGAEFGVELAVANGQG